MDKSRAFKVTQALLQKTVANGCTPSEAAGAAERSAAYIRRFGLVFEDAKGGQTPPQRPAARTTSVTAAPNAKPVRAAARWRPVVQTIGCVIGALGVLCAGCIVW